MDAYGTHASIRVEPRVNLSSLGSGPSGGRFYLFSVRLLLSSVGQDLMNHHNRATECPKCGSYEVGE